ncbi:heterokaryon incompatibility protein-domain-containing protein, partial [Rhexocercosporidium sp. MPI-PUGE-AT-0058]
SLRLAAQWVHDCFSNHNGCQRSTHMSGDPPWPTRVIDVGISDTDTVRLIVSDGTIKGKWAALSYRWGDVSSKSKETQSATMANLGSLQDEVPSNLLSATFLDAIRITRSLGLRYLWIDRLCILQDSDSDWMKEAAHMPLIYQNAQITIAAGSSNDGASGIFGNRKWAESSRQIDLPILSEEEISRVSIDFDTDLFQSSLESNCLNSRAWCFQEAQLSRRRLVFDREQTSFVCLQHGLQEKWASIEKVHPSYGFLVNKEPKLYKPIQSCTSDMLLIWYDMIEDYSGRDLTFATDRLVAIAGIAELVGQVLKDDYVAGMWKSTLPNSLLWSPHIKSSILEVDTYAKCSRPHAYTAPSWSWAAVCGKVWSSLCRQSWNRSPVTVLNVSTDADSTGPYGPINTGYLRIQSPLKRGHVTYVAAGDGEINRWPHKLFPGNPTTAVHCIFDIPSQHHQGSMEQLWCF